MTVVVIDNKASGSDSLLILVDELMDNTDLSRENSSELTPRTVASDLIRADSLND